MAPQRLDLGLSLGLGLASQPQPIFCLISGNVAAADQEVSPAAAEERTCSPGSPVSSGSGKRSERSTGSGDEDDAGCDGNARKKLRLSKDQAAVLEERFKTHHTLTPVNLDLTLDHTNISEYLKKESRMTWTPYACRSRSWLWRTA